MSNAIDIDGVEYAPVEVEVAISLTKLFRAWKPKLNLIDRLLAKIQHSNADESRDFGGAVLTVKIEVEFPDGRTAKHTEFLKGKCGTILRDAPYTREIIMKAGETTANPQ